MENQKKMIFSFNRVSKIVISMLLMLSLITVLPQHDAYAASKSISGYTVSLSTSTYTYDGKAKKPSVTVKNGSKKISSVYYSVSYSNNTEVGTATVTVKGRLGYGGTVSKTFTINPSGTSIALLTSQSKGFKVTWHGIINKFSGVEIQYSTYSNFAKATTVQAKSSGLYPSKTFSSLKSNTKYYVRIRTYKKTSTKTYYSSWSSSKSVKTK